MQHGKRTVLAAPLTPALQVDFVELLARSNFSFLMGASHPDEMVNTARRLGYLGLGICDLNGMYGIVRGFQAAEKPSAFDAQDLALRSLTEHRFRYHIGTELSLSDGSHISFLPTSLSGYSALCRLITASKRPAAKGRTKLTFDWLLRELGQCPDVLVIPLPPWNLARLEILIDTFSDQVYLPVTLDSTWESLTHYRQALALEQHFSGRLQLFATQRPLFHHPDRKPLHDVLTCLNNKVRLKDAKTLLLQNSERYLKPIDELRLIYRERPDLLTRTREISDRLHFSLKELRYHYPQEIIPKGHTAQSYLRELVEKGLRWRYGPNADNERVRNQVEHELKLIHELEYEDYFLTLWDVCHFARQERILHQGRGSAANSVVCFVLGLTAIDPIRLGLLFERFLSKERAEPPDIDIDFEHERREEVIQYIYRKYGAQHAAMVCTTICYRSRMAIRDVAKVFGVETEKADQMVKYMGRDGLKRLIDNPVSLTQFGLSEERFHQILSLAFELQGFPRHLGIHTGGFVISHHPIVDLVPVESATMDGRYVIQWNKDDVNLLGLMKVDVLSLGMLTALRKAFALLKEHRGVQMTLSRIPHEDTPTYTMIQKADTVGVFQIESRAQMALLPRLKPRTWYDLVVEVAIVRPGPIQGGMVHPYLKRRAGLEKITYAHPKLEPILRKTLGIPIFQEQIMQIAVAVAGFTPGEADELRRVVSSAWKKKAVMHGLRARLINGMLQNGLTVQYAETIYRTIEGFASYGFPESHAASFALITYASCWLKCHHPEIFTVAVLNSQPMGFYPPRQLLADAARHGVEIRPVCIQRSEWDYTIEGKSIRVGFRSINGFKEADAKMLIDARQSTEDSMVFSNLEDLIHRSALTKPALIRLAKSGALASFSESVRQILYQIEGTCLDQRSFFYASQPLHNEPPAPGPSQAVILPIESEWQKVTRELGSHGFSVDSHPIQVLRKHLVGFRKSSELKDLKNRSTVHTCGLLSLTQRPPTAKGVCFLSLEDETGITNVIVQPELYQKCRLLISEAGQGGQILRVKGQLQNVGGTINVLASEVALLAIESLALLQQSSSVQVPRQQSSPTTPLGRA